MHFRCIGPNCFVFFKNKKYIFKRIPIFLGNADTRHLGQDWHNAMCFGGWHFLWCMRWSDREKHIFTTEHSGEHHKPSTVGATVGEHPVYLDLDLKLRGVLGSGGKEREGRVAATVGSAPMASKLTELRPPRTVSSHNSPSRSVLGPRTLGPRDPESQGPKAQPNSASQIQESGNPPTVLISPSHSTAPHPHHAEEKEQFAQKPQTSSSHFSTS